MRPAAEKALDIDTSSSLTRMLAISYWRDQPDERIARYFGIDPKYVGLARRRRAKNGDRLRPSRAK